MINFIKENLNVILITLGSVLGYFTGLKLKKINEKISEADALLTMQKSYNEFVLDQKARYDELKDELAYMRLQLKQTKTEYNHLRDDLREEKNKYAVLEAKHMALKDAFEVLKKKLNN